MLKHEGTLVASASDFVNYPGCARRTTLDLIHLDTTLEKAPDDEQMQLVQDKGHAHEAGFLDRLRTADGLVEIANDATLDEKLERTRSRPRTSCGCSTAPSWRGSQNEPGIRRLRCSRLRGGVICRKNIAFATRFLDVSPPARMTS